MVDAAGTSYSQNICNDRQSGLRVDVAIPIQNRSIFFIARDAADSAMMSIPVGDDDSRNRADAVIPAGGGDTQGQLQSGGFQAQDVGGAGARQRLVDRNHLRLVLEGKNSTPGDTQLQSGGPGKMIQFQNGRLRFQGYQPSSVAPTQPNVVNRVPNSIDNVRGGGGAPGAGGGGGRGEGHNAISGGCGGARGRGN